MAELETKPAGEALQTWEEKKAREAEQQKALASKKWRESEILEMRRQDPKLFASLQTEIQKAREENRVVDDVSRTEPAIYRRDPDAKGAFILRAWEIQPFGTVAAQNGLEAEWRQFTDLLQKQGRIAADEKHPPANLGLYACPSAFQGFIEMHGWMNELARVGHAPPEGKKAALEAWDVWQKQFLTAMKTTLEGGKARRPRYPWEY